MYQVFINGHYGYAATSGIIVTYSDGVNLTGDWILCAIQVKGSKTFRDLMDYAVLNGFDKALASCEHCIVKDLTGKFNRMIQHMPPQSKRRIVTRLCQTFQVLMRPCLNP